MVPTVARSLGYAATHTMNPPAVGRPHRCDVIVRSGNPRKKGRAAEILVIAVGRVLSVLRGATTTCCHQARMARWPALPINHR
jgi:hypothetical protein